jgi:hypothetical protein
MFYFLILLSKLAGPVGDFSVGDPSAGRLARALLCNCQQCNDPPHFNFGSLDHRDLAILAFQQLWNSTQDEKIPSSENGVYGEVTKQRLRQAPGGCHLISPIP